jgi:hypothetical protein
MSGTPNNPPLDSHIRVDPNWDRESLFPDYGERQDLQDLGASFDPSSLLFQSDVPRGGKSEYDLLMAGNAKRVRRMIPWKTLLLTRRKKLSFILSLTSGIHELRHFHDYFGTTCGFARLMQVIEDAVEFSSAWDKIRSESRIKLPLAVWGKQADAPAPLREYLQKRKQFVEWINLFDGSMPSITFEGKTDGSLSILAYSFKGLSAVIPGAFSTNLTPVPRN